MSESSTKIRSPEECVMTFEGQINAGGARKVDPNSGKVYYDPSSLTEYPRMMYRATKEEERVQQTDSAAKCGETWLVVNNYGTPKEPLLCDIKVAHDVDEAEEMAAAGWEISAHAAHGKSDGIAKVTSAKDDEIARLKAELQAAQQNNKRGPGRPPKSADEPVTDPA